MEAKINEIFNLLNSENKINELSLYEGVGGQLLFRYIAGKQKLYLEDDLNSILIDKLANNIIDANKPQYTFASGISGISWLFHYLNKNKYIDLEDDFFCDIDEILVSAAFKYLTYKDYDFLHGAGGIIFSLLMRPEDNRISLELLTRHLLDSRIEFDEYKVWEFRSPNSPFDRVQVNMGLAHGLPSMLVLLSKLYFNNILPHECLEAINECYSFIKKQKNKNITIDSFSLYPTFVTEGEENTYKSRLAWCYGDLGVGIAMYVAGNNTNNDLMQKEAINIYKYYSDFINEPKLLVRDSTLCHGAAGVVHLYNRMYRNTKEPAFINTAEYWISVLKDMSHHEDGLAGYKACEIDGWKNSYSLLEGIGGIGLVLSSYLLNETPDWDECLLIS